MSKDINVLINSDTAVNNSVVSGSNTQTNVLISSPIEVLNTDYVIGSRGLYSSSLLGGVPNWVDEAVTYNVAQKLVGIQNQFSTLDLSFHNEVDRIDSEITNVENSVLLNLRSEINTTKTDILAELHQDYIKTANTNESIAELNTNLTSSFQSYTDTSISSLEQVYKTIANADEAIVTAKTELTSTFNNNIANALVEYQTKATADSVESRIRTDLSTQIDNNISSLSEVYLSKVDATNAEASLTSTLTATFNAGQNKLSASIQTTDEVVAGYFSEYTDESVDPKLGQFKLIDGVQYQYLGGYLGINSDGWVRTDQSAHNYTINQTNYLTDLVNAQSTALQGQIDGSITTWFDTGSPEFSELFATYQSDTDSTDDNSQDLTAGNFVWNIADNQMFKYNGSDANIDLNSVDYVGNSDWLAIYRINPKEEAWYDSDGIDTSNNYYWYEDGKIRPLKDADTPAVIEDRSKHIGDLYYDRNTGYAYRFAYEDIIDTPDEGVVFSWIRITDVDITKALGDAAKAQDTADGKRMIFNQNAIPTNKLGTNGYIVKIDSGDMWIPSDEVTEDGVVYKKDLIYIYVKGHNPLWVEVANYKNAVNAVQTDLDNWRDGDYSEFVTAIQTQADMKSSSYYQEDMPHEEGTNEEYFEWIGDLWKKPSNNNEYIYQLIDGNYKWVDADVPDIVYDTINTKKTIYTGNDTPNPSLPDKLENNDMWFTGSNPADTQYKSKEIYVYNFDDNTWNVPVRYTDDTTANEAHGWAGSASKFVGPTDGNGKLTGPITGWAFAAAGDSPDANQISEFAIHANHFYIQNSDSDFTDDKYRPFEINGSNITFRGKVTFSSISDASDNIPTISSVNTAATSANWSNIANDNNKKPKDNAEVNTINSGDGLNALDSNAHTKLSGIADNADVTSANTAARIANQGSLATKSSVANDDITSIDGGKITTGTLDANKVNVINLNASKITTGTLTANVIKSKSITYSEVKKGKINVAGHQKTLATHTYDNRGGSSTLIVVNTLIPGDALKTIRLYKDGIQIYTSANNLDWSYTLSIVDDAGNSTYVVKMDGYSSGNADVTYYISFIYFKK